MGESPTPKSFSSISQPPDLYARPRKNRRVFYSKADMGALSKFTEELADSICEHIAQGKSLVSWCNANSISYPTVSTWLREKPVFLSKYVRAREDQADFLAEEIMNISDDGRNDTYIDQDGGECTNHDVIARSRLRVDARKWYASKLAPKKYGDKAETVHTGAIDHNMSVTFVGK